MHGLSVNIGQVEIGRLVLFAGVLSTYLWAREEAGRWVVGGNKGSLTVMMMMD